MWTKSQRQRGGASLIVAITFAATLTIACPAEIAYVGAFGSGLAIYVVDEFHLTPRPLTSGPVDTAPAWSPDGARIAFARWVGDAPDIFMIDADGTHLTRLTYTPGQDAEPVWKPDGTALAFLGETDGTTAAYLVDPDGANLRRFPGLPDGIGSLDWSPDGQFVAFDRIVDYQVHLFIMDVATEAIRQLPGVLGSRPCWSPDGSLIAFSGDPHVGLIRPDGTGLRWLARQGGRNEHPTWSPDGTRIAYQSDYLGRDVICVVGVATGTFVRLTDIGTSPDWNPARAP